VSTRAPGLRPTSWSVLATVAITAALVLGSVTGAHAAPFVGDVDIVDGVGTVTLSVGSRPVQRQRITRDGGRTFQRLTVGGRPDATATLLANGLGYATAVNGRLWRSGDGGRTWTPTAVKDVFEVTATSTSAWVLRTRGNRVWLSRSDDGGRSWHTRRLRVGTAYGPAVRVAFADAADGVITGLRPRTSSLRAKPFLLVTRDGGRTWTERRQPCSGDAVGFKGPSIPNWLASGTLWLVCVGQGGAGSETLELHTSVDGGEHFTLQARAPLPGGGEPVGRFGGPGHITGFAAVSDRRAFMSFGYGFTVTGDGGHNWRSLRHLPRQPTGGVSELDVDGRDRYLAVAEHGLWKSSDAGATWRRLRVR